MSLGLLCQSETRLKKLERYIQDYGEACKKVSRIYEKDFNFPKQHAAVHVPDDVRRKGSTKNFSTRPGEGFQQEVRETFQQTNFREVLAQMTKIDENLEVMAQIKMNVDLYDAHLKAAEPESDREPDPKQPVDEIANTEHPHCAFGSAVPGQSSSHQQTEGFDTKLRTYLRQEFDVPLRDSDFIQIRQFSCMYLHYQSQDDFSAGLDIVRCNPSFHGRPRFDFVHINLPSETGILGLGQIVGLYQCRWGGPSGGKRSFVEVRMLEKWKWKPKTSWSGCDVRRLSAQKLFVNPAALVRAAHMHPAFGAPAERDHPLYYLDDAADNDWFIRSGN